METNNIRNYNEITNNGMKPSTKYIEKIVPIRTEEDKDDCLRFLTIHNKSAAICHGHYSAKYINTVIEYSDYFIYISTQESPRDIIAFALLKSKKIKMGKILDILLVCAIPNKSKFGNMISHLIYNFALKNKYLFLYVSPRTAELRQTFIKHGFESAHGIEGIDEVLTKMINFDIPRLQKRAKTLKVKRNKIVKFLNDLEDGNI